MYVQQVRTRFTIYVVGQLLNLTCLPVASFFKGHLSFSRILEYIYIFSKYKKWTYECFHACTLRTAFRFRWYDDNKYILFFQYSDDTRLTLDGGHEMPSAAAVTCQGGGARLTLAAQRVTRSVRRCLQPLALTADVEQSCGLLSYIHAYIRVTQVNK